jgi:hypothetical protein
VKQWFDRKRYFVLLLSFQALESPLLANTLNMVNFNIDNCLHLHEVADIYLHQHPHLLDIKYFKTVAMSVHVGVKAFQHSQVDANF